MSGMHRLLTTHNFERKHTYFVNIDHVGAGALRYVAAEGMFHTVQCSTEWRQAADKLAAQFQVRPVKLHALPSDAFLPMARGFHVIGITAADETESRPHWRQFSDTRLRVEYPAILRATDFVEALLRQLDHDLRESSLSTD